MGKANVPRRRGFFWDATNSELEIEVDGTKVLGMTADGVVVPTTRLIEVLTPTDLDATSGTLTVAIIVGGILVHTSVTGAGTLTTDTAANIIAGTTNGVGALKADGQCISCYVINDGDQTVTLAGGADVTISDTGQTIATNEAAHLIFRRASSTTVTCYVIGA